MHSLCEFAREANVWHACFAPHQVSVGSVSHATADGLFQTVFDAVETFRCALASQEWLVVGVVIRSDQVGSFSVGTGQHDGGCTHDVSSETCRDQFFASFLCWHQHFAAHVTAFLHSSQLVFEVNASSTGGDHAFHQFESV